jgi:hypothetical protein
MALPITIPNTFANANAAIPLSQLDNNFSTVVVAVNGIGNGAEALSNVNITGGSVAGANVSNSVLTKTNRELVTIDANGAANTINYDVNTQQVLLYTGNASANVTLNIRGNSSASLNNVMSTGQVVTIAFGMTNNATAKYVSLSQIDGSNVTPKWQGGTAPSAGNANSTDFYTYTVIKTGNAAFTVLASQTKFA